MKRVIQFSLVMVICFGLLAAAVVALGKSDGFLRWLLQREAVATVLTVKPAAVRGDLFGPIEISKATLRAGDTNVELENFSFQWEPSKLLEKRLAIRKLAASRVSVATRARNETTTPWEGFSSPIDVDVEEVAIARLELDPPGDPEGQLEGIALALGLAGHRLTLRHVTARHARASVRGAGQIDLTQAVPIDLALNWELTDSPLQLAGSVAIQGEIDTLNLSAQSGGDVEASVEAILQAMSEPIRAQATATIDRIQANAFDEFTVAAEGELAPNGDLTAEVNWRGLSWPTPSFPWHSPSGEFRVTGPIEQIDVFGKAEAVVQLPENPESQWQIDYRGTVTPEIITLDQVLIRGAGSASVAGSYNLTAGAGELRTEFQSLNPALFASEWPGVLDGTLDLELGANGVNLSIDRVAGELRGAALSGQGAISLASGDYSSADAQVDLALVWAKNNLNIRGGRRAREWQLELDTAASLSDVDPTVAGSATLHAVVAGRYDAPTLTLELLAQDLAYDGQALGTINLGASGRLSAEGFAGQLNALDVKGQWLEARLRSPAPLALDVVDGAAARFAVDSLCVDGNADFCVSAEAAANNNVIALEMRELPLALFKPMLADFQIRGVITGSAEIGIVNGEVNGGGLFSLSEGTLSMGPGASRLFGWHGADVKLAGDGAGFSAELNADLGDGDAVTLAAELAGPEINQLSGRFELTTKQLDALRVLLPEIKPTGGELHAAFDVSGTLNDPQLDGEFGLRNSVVDIIDLGITLDEANLLARLEGNQLGIAGSANVDGGTLAVEGDLDSLQPIIGNFTVRTNDLRFINGPEAELFANANLTAMIDQPNVDVRGNVSIPKGHIKAVPSTAVTASDDEVIVGELITDSTERWRATGMLQLDLGPELRLEAVGISGTVAGRLNLSLPADASPIGTGEIALGDGKFQIFRQTLDIDRGGLVFSGGPLTNPGLDIRASRTVGEQIVGVLARGPAGDPVIELFADPALSNADTLAYLTLGKPVNSLAENEQGIVNRAGDQVALSGGNLVAAQLGRRLGLDETSLEGTLDNASLVLGKYLSPRLYVSYGIGLAEAVDIIRLRFQLGRSWSVQAESGAVSSADLVYTIER